MKKLLLIILFTSNLAWAEENSDRWKRLPPIVLSMLEEFPHTAYAALACFDFPKININACEQLAEVDHPGSAYAKHNLGYSYQFGENAYKQSHTDAFYWYLRAANQGLDRSQHNLVRMYEFGLGVQVSHWMAKSLYERAANQGDKKAEARFEILMLLAINQAVEKGKFTYQGKLDYMTRLEPWQIKEANHYFDKTARKVPLLSSF